MKLFLNSKFYQLKSCFLFYIFNLLIHVSFSVGVINGDIFTSVWEMERLIETEEGVIKGLSDYIYKEEKRLEAIKSQLDVFKKAYDLAIIDVDDYVENPINAFTLIKRLTVDLTTLEQTIHETTEFKRDDKLLYPNGEDLLGAGVALGRLQRAYRLNVTELADGILKSNYSRFGNPYLENFTPMTSADCFQVGRTVYEQKQYPEAIDWFLEAHRKATDHLIDETSLLEYIALAYNTTDDVQNAVKWSKMLLALDPGNPRGNSILQHQQNRLEIENGAQEKHERYPDVEKPESPMENLDEKWKAFYYALCRGDFRLQNSMIKRLKCSYLNGKVPFLRLAPIKMEQLYIRPDIFMFYDVMSDKEIEEIKSLAKSKLKRSGVVNATTGLPEAIDDRISKTAWLYDSTEVVARVTRRTSSFTGLNATWAQPLQVANYGIGGFYRPHFDFSRMSVRNNLTTYGPKWRIATVMYYMSDVTQGGATVFTELGLTVYPVKGAALYWMNVHPSGEGDTATRHAACPVLRGSKWASNKWILEYGQLFRRPCSLVHEKHGILYDKHEPVRSTSDF